MFPIETVRRCERCGEKTPHVRHRLPRAGVSGLVALAAAAIAGIVGGSGWDLAAVLAAGGVVLALLGLLTARSRCERCRTRAHGTGRPSLRGNTTIDFL